MTKIRISWIYRYTILLPVFIVWLLPLQNILANPGYASGTFFIDVKYGRPFYQAGSVQHTTEKYYRPAEEVYPYILLPSLVNSTNANLASDPFYKQLLWVNLAGSQPELKSREAAVDFEYGWTDSFSLGAGLSADWLRLENVRVTSDPDNNLADSALTSPSLLRAILVYGPLFTNAQIDPYLSYYAINGHISYHFIQRSMFDPFARFSIGPGLETVNSKLFLRISLSAGMRIFLSEELYVLGELHATQIQSFDDATRPGNNHFTTGWRMGLGVKF